MTLITPIPTVPEPGQRIVVRNVDWDLYDRMLEAAGDSHLRITYHQGRMEMMYPSEDYEDVKKAIARLIEVYALEAGIPVKGLGSVTCRRHDVEAGLEPDECYYVRTPPPPASRRRALDLAVHPPPDLGVEVDVTRSSVPREPVYAVLGVPEVWRHNGERIIVLLRQPDGTYRESERSLAFPDLPMDVFGQFLRQARADEPFAQHDAALAFRAWVRDTMPPT